MPYLYSEDELAALIAATDTLRYPLQRATYRTLICLLAVTGMRVGEAIGLDDNDLDVEHGVLAVTGKFAKPRQVPLHPSSVAALAAYRRYRKTTHPQPRTTALFVSTPGNRLINVDVNSTFLKLVGRAGLAPRSALCRPRPHDLRTVSRSLPCWTGTATVATSRSGSRCSRPTSGTSTQPTPTGITPILGLLRYLLLCSCDGPAGLG